MFLVSAYVKIPISLLRIHLKVHPKLDCNNIYIYIYIYIYTEGLLNYTRYEESEQREGRKRRIGRSFLSAINVFTPHD